MKYREVEKLLRSDGWILIRMMESHYQFKKAGSRYTVTAPNHKGHDLSIGVLKDSRKKQAYPFGGKPSSF